MKRYQCHKVVEAAKVVGFEMQASSFTAQLVLDDDTIVDAPHNVFRANTRSPVGGYYVRYEDGYTSWSPAAAFEGGYKEIKPDARMALSFSAALDRCKAGAKIARAGWNGRGMWVEIQRPDAGSKMTLPYLYLNYPADAANTPGARVPWLASQTDMLADDWYALP